MTCESPAFHGYLYFLQNQPPIARYFRATPLQLSEPLVDTLKTCFKMGIGVYFQAGKEISDSIHLGATAAFRNAYLAGVLICGLALVASVRARDRPIGAAGATESLAL